MSDQDLILNALKQDGKKEVPIRKVVYSAKNHLPTIRSDLDLLEKLLGTYTAESQSPQINLKIQEIHHDR
jgi:hypothetical protein